MKDEQLRELLKDEYLHLEQAIRDFDGRALTIKAWSVTFSLFAIMGAFHGHAPGGLLLASFASCLFWSIEVMWKTFQYAFYERINQIEDFFAGKSGQPDPLQIGRAWYQRWSTLPGRKLLCIMAWPHVALPHVVVAVLGVTLFSLYAAGVIEV